MTWWRIPKTGSSPFGQMLARLKSWPLALSCEAKMIDKPLGKAA
jgi:hypothetical protein